MAYLRLSVSIVFADFAAKPADNSHDMVTARREAIAYISMPEFAAQYAAEHLMFTTPLDVQDEVAAMIAGVNSKIYLQAMQQSLLEDFSPLVEASPQVRPTYVAPRSRGVRAA